MKNITILLTILFPIILSSEINLDSMSLEDLMNVKVYSASKKSENLSETSSAVFILTSEDIRRGGHRTIPEALRMVPGINVARVDASKWAVASRGFNSLYSNKLLVLVDGRSVYTPLFAGTYWDEQDLLLEDVDRIEVIRGPGATLWGANAVNGVVNIITKDASKTKGGFAEAGFGSEERAFGSLRYGSNIGKDFNYRFFTKYTYRDEFMDINSNESFDDWDTFNFGTRADWQVSNKDKITLTGNIRNANTRQRIKLADILTTTSVTTDDKRYVNGGHLLSRWTHNFSEKSDLQVQFFYDRINRTRSLQQHGEIRDTYDIDIQNRIELTSWNELTYGLNFRYIEEKIEDGVVINFDYNDAAYRVYSFFIQDKISIIKNNKLYFTPGIKLEHHPFVNWEVQPSLKGYWSINDNNNIWMSISRAVQTPARAYTNGTIRLRFYNTAPPVNTLLIVQGNNAVQSENMTAFELGYRYIPSNKFKIEFTTFYNKYTDLISLQSQPITLQAGTVPYAVLQKNGKNDAKGESYGLEINTEWNVYSFLKLKASYTFLHKNLFPGLGYTTADLITLEGSAPRNQVFLGTLFTLPYNFEFDVYTYYVDALYQKGMSSYIRLDTRLGWSPIKSLRLSVVAQNINSGGHPEYTDIISEVIETTIPRSIYFIADWKF
jgi:iron complex outermembrane receptor protein